MPEEIERKIPCPCGSGKRYRQCCFPRDRAREAAVSATRAAHAAVDEAGARAVALVEKSYAVACRAGCNACCESHIRTTEAEARAIAAWLAAPERAEVRARFEARLPAWRAAVGPELVAIDRLLARHKGAPTGGADLAAFTDAVREHHRRRARCPFNDDDGRCAIYEVRPLPCRATWVVETADYCLPDRGRGPTVVREPAFQSVVVEARRSLARLGARERALPEAVADALAGK